MKLVDKTTSSMLLQLTLLRSNFGFAKSYFEIQNTENTEILRTT